MFGKRLLSKAFELLSGPHPSSQNAKATKCSMRCSYKGKELRELNQCRLYLRFTSLADIINGIGNKLLIPAVYCTRSKLMERRLYERPTQPEPNQHQKLLWHLFDGLGVSFPPEQGRTMQFPTQDGSTHFLMEATNDRSRWQWRHFEVPVPLIHG